MIGHTSRITRRALLVGMLLLVPAQLMAQGPSRRLGISMNPARLHSPQGQTQSPRPSTVSGKESEMWLGGLMGAVIGGVVGGVGARILVFGSANSSPDDDCGIATTFRGVIVGEGFGFGLGSYLAGGREQNAAKRILIPAAVSVVLLTLAEQSNNAWPLAAIFPVQLISINF